jgi:hypothetical protein
LKGTDVQAARGALHVVFEEYDAWSTYVDDYDSKMGKRAFCLFWLIAITSIVTAFILLGFEWRPVGLVVAAAAGAMASVAAKLPPLTNYGEWAVNDRAVWTRLSTGLVGSLVGIGLISSGLIAIEIPGPWKSLSELFNSYLAPRGVPSVGISCTPVGSLFVMAMTMLLAFSERVLTSLEGRVVPTAPAARTPNR